MLLQKQKMLKAELSIAVIFPSGSVRYWLVPCSPSQTNTGLILSLSECKVMPGCWEMKSIFEMHCTRLSLEPGGEKGSGPISQ